MAALLEDADANLSPRMRRLLEGVWQEWKQLETHITEADDEIERIASADASDCGRSPEWDRWLLPQPLRPSAMARPSARDATLPPGSV